MRSWTTWVLAMGMMAATVAGGMGGAGAGAPEVLAVQAGAHAPGMHIAAWAALRGTPLDEAQMQQAGAMDALPLPAALAVARVVDTFAAFEAATVHAFDGVDRAVLASWAEGQAEGPAAPPATVEALWAEARFDPAAILAARAELLAAVLDLRGVLASLPMEARPTQALEVPGLVVVGITARCTDDTYTTDLPLLVDECGDDVYRNNAGGSNLMGTCLGFDFGPGAAALVDLAGDDTYANGRGCGTHGGAAIGAGFLLDAAGNDAYVAPTTLFGANKGVNGGGAWLGQGFLMDLAGDDVYTSGGWGTNGGGYIGGNGALHDLAGDDVYEASFDGVNGGGSLGIGLLLDHGGRDAYRELCHDVCIEAWDHTEAPKGTGAQIDR